MDNTIKHIDFLWSTIPTTLNIFNAKNLKPTQLFSVGLLERLYYASYSISFQIENYKNHKQLDFSIGLTLRALLLDALTSFNLYKVICDLQMSGEITSKIETIADQYCNRVLADGIQ